LGIHTLSDLASKASQVAFYLPSDSTYVLDYLKPKYNLTASSFQSLNKVDISIAFQEVANGQNQAKANFCYSTDQRIQADHLVVLQDNNHAFPAYHPAPIVRDNVLTKSPAIATTLNKLAPFITTSVSLQLQNQVAQLEKQGASPTQALYQTAKQFLTSKGFCKAHGCPLS
jgi:glycine betaine/choline ABC-type transport system substrate-binding protein